MAGNELKAKLSIDTSQYNKGMKDATKSLNDFKKEGTGALSEVASMFGVNSRAVETLGGKLGQCVDVLKNFGNTGGNATQAVTLGMKALGASIAGLGIMGAVAAFKELNAQAINFEGRLQGLSLAASSKAWRQTYTQAMYDASGAGEKWAKAWEWVKSDFLYGWTNFKTAIIGGTNQADRAEATGKADKAAELAKDMVGYLAEQRDLSVEIQDIDNQIYATQWAFKNKQLDLNERKQAEATLTDLINQKYDKQVALQQKITDNIKARNSLTTNPTLEQVTEEKNAEKTLLALEGQRQREKNAMLRTSNGIAGAMERQAKAAQNIETALEKVVGKGLAEELNAAINAEIIKNDVGVQRIYDEGFLSMLKGVPGFDEGAQRLKIPGMIEPDFDVQEWTDISEQIASIIEDALSTVAASVGELIGDLATGGDAWGNFTNSAIRAFGDMAVKVGEMAIATGVASLGIKAALESLNGYAAIAAGAALVALGSAVRAGLSNMASGGGYSTSVASSAYTSGYGASAYGREMEVKVTGTLTANGSKLVAVLNNENDRKNYTT